MLKQIFKYWMAAVFLLLASSLSFAAPDSQYPSGPLNATQAEAVMNKYGSRLYILDVRSPKEFEQGHLPTAVNIPVGHLENEIHKIPRGPVLIICRTGRRAKIAWDLIHQARPKKQKLWYLHGAIVYGPNGTHSYR